MPLINETEALARFDNDRAIYLELIQAFLDSGAADFSAMQSDLSSGNAASIQQHAHRIKGASLAIGADSLAQIAGNVEAMARDRHTENMAKTFETMEQIFRESLSELVTIRNQLKTQI